MYNELDFWNFDDIQLGVVEPKCECGGKKICEMKGKKDNKYDHALWCPFGHLKTFKKEINSENF